MKALILAGGFGTRLKSITGEEIPKPMAAIAGKPFLEHQINFLKNNGINEIVLAIHYKANKIKSYFGSGLRWGVNITYCEEEIPLGTAGAIKNAERYMEDTFIIMNGDSYAPINLDEFIKFHKSRNSFCTLCLAKINIETLDYGSVIVDNDYITKFCEKEEIGSNLINGGIYIVEPGIFQYIPKDREISLEKEIFPNLSRIRLLKGYIHDGYFMDIGKPETYKKFKSDVLSTIFLKQEASIIDAIERMNKNEINLILIVDDDNKLLGVLTDRIIKRFIINGGDIRGKITQAMITDPVIANVNDEDGINKLLSSGINSLPVVDENKRVVDIRFRLEKMYEESYPIIRGKSPLRISFGGGGTDLPYFFEKYGGAVINATIDKYCYATIVKRADKKIIIDSDLTPEEDIFVSSIEELVYDNRFDLVKAIIKIIRPSFGFELYLHNDVPPGRGLGSSASLAVLLINMLGNIQGVNYSDEKIAEIAYRAEREELKIRGGWQDQYAAIGGGFNFMEFDQDKRIIYPLRLKEDVIHELNSRLILCYIGKDHNSGEVHGDNWEKTFKENEEEVSMRLRIIKENALKIKDALLTNRLDEIGKLLHESWENKKKLGRNISNLHIDEMYEIGLNSGAIGGKLLGAGSGGYLLFFHQPQRRNQLINSIKKNSGEILNFNFESLGTRIWNVKQ
ncbi:CBS domain-containing protein [Candidatus Pacearchaeota archaeon]|nr:CBS domain-containing protein [Candidatus Pacearchaeota archaeon]